MTIINLKLGCEQPPAKAHSAKQCHEMDKNPMPSESCLLRQKIRVGFRPGSPMAVARYN